MKNLRPSNGAGTERNEENWERSEQENMAEDKPPMDAVAGVATRLAFVDVTRTLRRERRWIELDAWPR